MEVPKKIYLSKVSIESLPDEDPLFSTLQIKEEDDDIEYTRTDAFIEKAQLFLIDKLEEIPMGWGKMKIKANSSLEDFIMDFKKYMKG